MTMTSAQHYRPWRFLVLLVTLVLLLVIQPIIRGFSPRGLVLGVLYSLVLVAAILSIFEGKWPKTFALILGIPALAGRWFAYMLASTGEDIVNLGDQFVEVVFLVFVAVMTLRAILAQPRVSADSIYGTICAYLLLGAAWGSLYSVQEIMQPGSYAAGDDLAPLPQAADTRDSVLVYYSFVTLTTVGYGDITPVSAVSRTLSWLEAMMGQFYIAVLVASLVGIRVSQGRRDHRQADEGGNWVRSTREAAENMPDIGQIRCASVSFHTPKASDLTAQGRRASRRTLGSRSRWGHTPKAFHKTAA